MQSDAAELTQRRKHSFPQPPTHIIPLTCAFRNITPRTARRRTIDLIVAQRLELEITSRGRTEITKHTVCDNTWKITCGTCVHGQLDDQLTFEMRALALILCTYITRALDHHVAAVWPP
jgi:hypothetical protein